MHFAKVSRKNARCIIISLIHSEWEEKRIIFFRLTRKKMAPFRPRIILEDHPAVLITDTSSAFRNATRLTSPELQDLSLISWEWAAEALVSSAC
ncbi:hypothetical protein CEXT_768671 [Caerostris extrusa]|uniref:Transposase n=1 Tax=Caerostris extrusa TaxID=172846 RepID=A0AAV4RR54_CAEEX|nr:hypothetical protein CEXT_768671 [Caerostris extrusa]